MTETSTDLQKRRRRAGLGLGMTSLTVLVILAVIATLVISHSVTGDSTIEQPRLEAPNPDAPADDSGGAGNLSAENALATRPMVALPPQAARPQRMTTRAAGPPIDIPQPDTSVGRWIPGGFPNTPEGALAQLRALDEAGMAGGDPAVYARAYRTLSLPDAPRPESTGLYSLLSSMRSSAGIAPKGLIPDLSVHYQVTHGQIKGTTDNGRYAVVCVLGQLSVDYQGQTLTAGVGDCQAMRWTGTAWRISPGALAAPAPSAWPGSEDAVRAGYRELI